jgi:hypothetical protein
MVRSLAYVVARASPPPSGRSTRQTRTGRARLLGCERRAQYSRELPKSDSQVPAHGGGEGPIDIVEPGAVLLTGRRTSSSSARGQDHELGAAIHRVRFPADPTPGLQLPREIGYGRRGNAQGFGKLRKGPGTLLESRERAVFRQVDVVAPDHGPQFLAQPSMAVPEFVPEGIACFRPDSSRGPGTGRLGDPTLRHAPRRVARKNSTTRFRASRAGSARYA